jgi:hypothetical protein
MRTGQGYTGRRRRLGPFTRATWRCAPAPVANIPVWVSVDVQGNHRPR